MTMEELAAILRRVKPEAGEMKSDAKLSEMGLTSFDRMIMIFEVEKVTKKPVSLEKIKDAETLEELYRGITEN